MSEDHPLVGIFSSGYTDLAANAKKIARGECSCSVIYVGCSRTESREWRGHCVQHGVDSVWYNSDEQVERRRTVSENLRDIQRQAAEARRNARNRSINFE